MGLRDVDVKRKAIKRNRQNCDMIGHETERISHILMWLGIGYNEP